MAQEPAAPSHSWTTEQIITSSVREAWALGGKTEEGFFDIVQALTEIAAQKRGITLPNTKEAGTKAGNWIKKEAKKDPDQLLYVIVDRAVRYTAAHPARQRPPSKGRRKEFEVGIHGSVKSLMEEGLELGVGTLATGCFDPLDDFFSASLEF